ncbi:MAG: VCBS repeat-containing protein, partial [Planctomycetota bacterium]|nr:VCBS repeat-containing protein [Planctomycetota bacterium]
LTVVSGTDDRVSWHRNETGDDIPPQSVRRVLNPLFAAPMAIAAGDFDSDGDTDVSALSSNAFFRWLYSDGAAPPDFSEATIPTAASLMTDQVLGDFNDDGVMDMVVSAQFGARLWWLEGVSNQNPPQFTSHPIPPDLGSVSGLAICRFDDDDLTDLLTTSGLRIRLYRGQTPQPLPFAPPQILIEDYDGVLADPVDLDGDGDLDLLLPDKRTSTALNGISWAERLPGPEIAFAPRRIIESGFRAWSAVAGDFNSDGLLDLAVGGDRDVRVYTNLGGSPPQFEGQIILDLYTFASFRQIAVLDFDNDGDLDIASAAVGLTSDWGDAIHWHENIGGDPVRFIARILEPDMRSSFTIHAADLDNDGDDDLLYGDEDNFQLIWRETPGSPIPADLNGDGAVNAADLAALLGAWGP